MTAEDLAPAGKEILVCWLFFLPAFVELAGISADLISSGDFNCPKESVLVGADTFVDKLEEDAAG